ncbi:FGGY-family carbohydrate kinase [Sedimentitalea sp.]|uniref:xylulokinase n=1 Tax=Sedimentitalea sp. TaxID=2048915 RepID=UPI003297054C
MSQILAFDLGGSSLRLALVAPDGRFLAYIRKPIAIEHKHDGHFEVEPAVWWQAFEDGCAELAAEGHDFASVTAVAGCGFTRTQVFLDKNGSSVRPAITFQDSRATEALEEFRANAPSEVADALEVLNPFDPLARLLWLRVYEPDTWSMVHKILEPKDYLNLRLTGNAVSDQISQMPMTRNLAAGPDALLSALGINLGFLPSRKSPYDQIGTLLPGLPYPLSEMSGIPVYCGSFDTWCCVLGSGALKDGAAYNISGTSDVSGVLSQTHSSAPGLLTVEWGPGLWQLGGPSQGASTRIDWALDRFCPDLPRNLALKRALRDRGSAPLFLPYLDGERTPHWDSDMRGAFLGLSSFHENPDFIRGVAEGINYLSRDVLHRAERAIGDGVTYVSFSGGLSGSPELCQLKADILARPVRVPQNSETGLLGAAKIPPSSSTERDTAQDQYVTYRPNADQRQYHDARFRVFREATKSLQPLSLEVA